MKKVTRDDKTRNGVPAFGNCRWEWIKVKRGGEKCKPTKRSNLNYHKIQTSFKKRKQEYDQNNGQAERITLKGYRSEELFNYADLSMSNIYYKISLHMFLTKFLVLENSSFWPSYFKSN